MTTSEPRDRASYDQAREAFDRLDPADKAVFLLESAFGAAGEIVAEGARAVADVVDRAASADFWTKAAGATDTPDPADPADPGGPAATPRTTRRPSAPGAADAGSPSPGSPVSGPTGTPPGPSASGADAPSPGKPGTDPLI